MTCCRRLAARPSFFEPRSRGLPRSGNRPAVHGGFAGLFAFHEPCSRGFSLFAFRPLGIRGPFQSIRDRAAAEWHVPTAAKGMRHARDAEAVSMRVRSRQRAQVPHERELLLEVVDQRVVGCHALAVFALGERDIEAIVEANPHLRGDVEGPWDEVNVG